MTKPATKVPLSVLDLCPIRTGGSASDALANSLDLARHAEQLGYHRYWVAEHHNMPGIASAATAVVIAHLAQATKTIRMGSGGIMLLNHAPLAIAEQFGTLESLFPGRIDLGVGRAPGTDQGTVRRLRDSPDLSGESFPDKLAELRSYFAPRSSALTVHAVPGAGLEVPIWLLGSGGFSAQLAGHLGLPFASAGHFSPDNVLSGLETYRKGFRRSATLSEPYAMVGINIFAAATDEEAFRLASSHLQAHLSLARGVPVQLPPPVEDFEALLPGGLANLSFLRGSIIGSPGTVRSKLESLLEVTRADELIVHSMIFDHDARRRSYEIVMEVAGEGKKTSS